MVTPQKCISDEEVMAPEKLIKICKEQAKIEFKVEFKALK